MNMICIVCPMGCPLSVEKTADGFKVSGNTCPRGEKYAIAECTAPTRTLTSIVPVKGKDMVSVKSSAPLPKEKIFDCVNVLATITLDAPVKVGDIIVKDILGTGVDIVATKNIP
ncbi:MAG: DUF1667 domain-containing protein [Clostridia bacterium]|nr:DUF1667 domain-containing protein [Clostridia bacterium]